MELVPRQTSHQQYTFADRYPIRVIDQDGETWFVAADVCRALELNNVSQAVSRLDEDEKDDLISNDVAGRPQRMVVVNEAGLYALILASRKPEAKAFKRWVTHEVLPSIRKTGGYVSRSASLLDVAEAMIAGLRAQEREIAALKEGQQAHDQRLADIEARQAASEFSTDYFTIVGFANQIGRRLTNDQAQSLGRYAGRYSRKHKYPIGEVADPRYGKVNTYHIEVLRAVFGMGAEH